MNIAEVLNYVYQVVLPYASMVDVRLTDVSVKDVIAFMYVVSLPIGFLRGIYNVPGFIREVPSDTKEDLPVLVFILCVMVVVVYTFFGIFIAMWHAVELFMKTLIKYAMRNVTEHKEEPVCRSDGL